ncbi:MAG TPA: ABC transporter substrate-binding protein [Kofleriaceae bacterium]|nr:ABC transporter substrate-binding protein [Kofleriaceae bacterium]
MNPVLEPRFTRANQLVFEGLVGLSSSLEPVPVLAESWTRSDDGRQITFKLRKGVKWHDGKPFTSKDVAFTYQSIRDTQSQTLWKPYFAAVSKLDTPDEQTVVVTYSKPYAPALIAWTVGLLPAHVYGGGPLAESRGNREPVGTGPFRMARWIEGKRLVFEANKAWWNGRPNLDTVELRVDLGDDQLKALKDGQLDFVQVPDVEAWSGEVQMPDFRADFEVSTVVGSLFRAIAWNVQRKPFDDKRVRLAMTLALNRGRIIEDLFFNQAQPMSAPFFPNMFGADPSIAPYPFDIERAVKVLDEAGHPAGPNGRFPMQIIAVASQRTPQNEQMFAIFRTDLAAIGIDMKVEYLSSRDYQARVVLRDFDGVFFGWLPDIPDPDPSALLHSSQIKEGKNNFAGYADADADKLIEAASGTNNRAERKAIYHKLHAKVNADLPYTVLYAPYSHYAWSRRLHGVHPEDIGPQPRFPGLSGWWVDP